MKVPLALTALPAFLIISILMITENFSVHPSLSQAPLVSIFLSIFAVITAVVAYKVVKDEEEIAEEEKWKYRVLEGLNLGYMVISVLMIMLVVTLYFLKA